MVLDSVMSEVHRVKDELALTGDFLAFTAQLRTSELRHGDRLIQSLQTTPQTDTRVPIPLPEPLARETEWEDPIVAEVRRIRDELYRQSELAKASPTQQNL